jgi:hypothetical protein
VKNEEKMNPEEKRLLLELRALKKEFRDAGMPNKAVTIDNLLMKKCGADFPYRYDGFPPDHYLYDMRHGKPRQKVMAWVYAGTIALQRNSPFVVDAYGHAQDVEDLAVFYSWGTKMAEGELLSAESDGVLRRDPPIVGKRRDQVKRRIWICAKVALAYTDYKGLSNLEGVCTDSSCSLLSSFLRCEPYLKKEFEEKPVVEQADFLARHIAINEFTGAMETDGRAGIRIISDYLHHLNWNHIGVKVRDPKPGDGRKMRAHPAMTEFDNPFRVTAGCVKVGLSAAVPDAVLAPETREPPATNGNQVDALRRHRDQIWARWKREKTKSRGTFGQIPKESPKAAELERVLAALDGHIKALEDAAQAPATPLLEAIQAPPVPGGTPENAECVHIEKRYVHTPTSLLPSLTPTLVTATDSGNHTSFVSQSPPDGLTRPRVATQAAGASQTPPIKPATPPRATSTPAAAIPQRAQPRENQAPAGDGATGERTGLTGTPSIELRAARAERLTQIAAAVPAEMIRRCQERVTPHLQRQIYYQLCNAPIPHFQIKVEAEWARRPAYFTSLGLLIHLAEDVGRAWAAGAPEREKAAAEEERVRKRQEQERDRSAGEMAAELRKRAHLVAHPEDCPRCAGRAEYSSDMLPAEIRPKRKVTLVCGCPAGETLMEKRRKGARS